MKTVKLNTSFGHAFLSSQLNPQLSNYTFEIDNDCSKCDYWIVWGDLPEKKERMVVDCPPGNIIYMTDEAFAEKKFDPGFLDQFDAVLTCRNDISHRRLIKTPEINVWHLKKSYADVFNSALLPKSKMLSVVSSDLTLLPGHKRRYAFVNRLIGHFKDRLDVFGRGFNPVDDKWQALAPYKYSIAIENSSLPGYFTEKITECYLAHAMPIYYGAPDISNYFDPSSFLPIDIDNYKQSILSIERLLEEDPWENKQELLIKQKLLYLSKYHLFPALCRILDGWDNTGNAKKRQSIRSHRSYERYYRIKKLLKLAKNRLQ